MNVREIINYLNTHLNLQIYACETILMSPQISSEFGNVDSSNIFHRIISPMESRSIRGGLIRVRRIGRPGAQPRECQGRFQFSKKSMKVIIFKDFSIFANYLRKFCINLILLKISRFIHPFENGTFISNNFWFRRFSSSTLPAPWL